ncbi:hypothetical protein IG631_10407 [Alternaria alternata]|nr:hypothetical protein IG631_10407 [Alternaria alternata]
MQRGPYPIQCRVVDPLYSFGYIYARHPSFNPYHPYASCFWPVTGHTAPSAAPSTLGCVTTLFLWCPTVALVTGHTSPSLALSMSGWSGGRTVVAVPTTGQRASSISWALVSLTVFLRAGHDVASLPWVGTGGCECRLWWWSVVAPTTGHYLRVSLVRTQGRNFRLRTTWPSFARSIEGWFGGRTSLVVPITGQDMLINCCCC